MKKVLIAAAALLALSACGPKGPKDYVVSEGIEANLGKIKEADGKVAFRLLAVNDQPDTLFPKFIYTQCGCTVAQTNLKPVAPGETEVIEVTYNPSYKKGKIMEEIQVMYQHSPIRMRSFIIVGEVIPCSHPIEDSCRYPMGLDLYSSHKMLSFGAKSPGETADIFFRYGNGGKRKMDLRFDVPEEWQPYLRLRQPGKLKADQRDTVHVKLTMPAHVDSVQFYIQPLVNGKPTDVPISIRARKRAEGE